MKPSNLIHQTSPARLSEVRRELTGKAYRQEHSTRDKKKLLETIEEIEKIIEKLGYKINVEKNKPKLVDVPHFEGLSENSKEDSNNPDNWYHSP